jgi:hypothetical protein
MATETPSKLDGWSLLRAGLIAVGSGFAAQGSGAGLTEGDIESLAGAIVSILTIIWGIYVRWNARSVPLPVAVRPDIPVKSSATGKVTTGRGVPL